MKYKKYAQKKRLLKITNEFTWSLMIEHKIVMKNKSYEWLY